MTLLQELEQEFSHHEGHRDVSGLKRIIDHIKSLEDRVKLAEKCMGKAWSYPFQTPESQAIFTELKIYREKYPAVLNHGHQ